MARDYMLSLRVLQTCFDYSLILGLTLSTIAPYWQGNSRI
jgi:hypothetical protein